MSIISILSNLTLLYWSPLHNGCRSGGYQPNMLSSLLSPSSVSSVLSSPDSSSSSLLASSGPSSISSALFKDNDDKGTAAAPVTPVTFTVCHSDNGELGGALSAPMPAGKGLRSDSPSLTHVILAVSSFSPCGIN